MRDDPFYSNSMYFILTQVVAAVIGLVFWSLAARSYDRTDIGVATTIISTIGTVQLISSLGVDKSLMRFFPEGDKGIIFSSATLVVTTLTLMIGGGLILTSSHWSPELGLVDINGVLFLLLLITTTFVNMATTAFVSMRRTKYAFIQNILTGSRLLFLFPLAILGSVGILGSFLMAYVLTLLFSLFTLYRFGIAIRGVDWGFIRRSMGFSLGNYVSTALAGLPFQVLPLLVFIILGAEKAAVYFMAYSFATIVFIVPKSCGSQVLVEGSYGEDLRRVFKKSMMTSLLLLVPAVVIIFLLGRWFLSLLGQSYAEEGLVLLELLAASGLFMSSFYSYQSVKMVQKDIFGLMAISAVNCALIIGLSLICMNVFGLEGIGIGWILGFVTMSIVIWSLIRKLF